MTKGNDEVLGHIPLPDARFEGLLELTPYGSKNATATPAGGDEVRAEPKPTSTAGVSLDDFAAYMPSHNYIYKPTREPWPGNSVDARIPPVPLFDRNGQPLLDATGKQKTIAPSAWLDHHAAVEQMTWAPGEPMLIRNRLVADGGWIARSGVTCFNLYRPPIVKPGDAAKAGPWLEHGRKVFGDDFEHIEKWLAHRAQRPHEKINHALVLGGEQGIGKDTVLEPIKDAVGPWNFQEVNPQQLVGRFNGYAKSVVLRVSEAHDLGDLDRYKFYEHTKTLIAAPPDVLRVDEKNLREHSVLNCTGVVILTNHKTDGIFLPSDDRRHFVAWSHLRKEDFADDYWKKLYDWYASGGTEHVAAYLRQIDLSSFDAKAPPPKTAAFWEIVDASRPTEDGELSDLLEGLCDPPAITLDILIREAAGSEIQEWLKDRKNRRVIGFRLEKCGYTSVRNDAAQDGLWKIGGKRQAVYGRQNLSARQRGAEAAKLGR